MVINKSVKIYIAGHKGMVGSACVDEFYKNGYKNLLVKSKKELDLTNQKLVKEFFEKEKPDIVINSAAKVGGIFANDSYPYDFLMQNMQIQNNLIYYSNKYDVKKFIFLGSSCIYPKFSKQPIKEEYLLSGPLEPTNQWYAIAKISGLKLIDSLRKQFGKDFISLMPTNLYGPRDNFDLVSSHVLPAMIRKFYDAKINNKKNVFLWGSGTPKREFLYVNDLAKVIVFCLENNLSDSIYNVGSSHEISIKDLAETIKGVVKFNGNIVWDNSKPDGTPRKLLDSSRINKLFPNNYLDLKTGIQKTYDWFIENNKL